MHINAYYVVWGYSTIFYTCLLDLLDRELIKSFVSLLIFCLLDSINYYMMSIKIFNYDCRFVYFSL